MKLPIKLPNAVTRFFGKAARGLKHAGPEFCIGGGILLGAGALILVGIETWKGKDDISEKIDEIKTIKKNESSEIVTDNEGEEMMITEKIYKTEDEQKKALKQAYLDLGKTGIKIYWKPLVMGGGAVFLIAKGRSLFRKEILELGGLLAAATKSYDQLYSNVRNEFGDGKAQELAHGAKTVDIVDSETGEVKKVPSVDRQTVNSPYAVYFDAGDWDEKTQRFHWKNTIWNRDKRVNIFTIRSTQSELNRLLVSRGWATLLEMCEMLHIPAKSGWHRIGWKWTKEKEARGENFVELGVLEGIYQMPFNYGFTDICSDQNVCLINPNVDGLIDDVFDNLEEYDLRFDRHSKSGRKHLPTADEMFGMDFARKARMA